MVPASQLSGCRLTDLNGQRVRLGDEWRERPAVVVWLRHFGCLLCKEQAADFVAHRPEIEALGARLVFVGNGEVAWAREFEAEHSSGCRVLADPELVSYRAIGARRGWATTVGPRAVAAGLRALRRGFRQTQVRGVADQQGGVYVIAPGDLVLYFYLSGYAGDHPPVDDVLSALGVAAGGQAWTPLSSGTG